jgi:TP901 family phage tail tape measure protein
MGTLQVVLGVGIAAPIALAVRQYALLEQKINSIRSLSGATVGQMRSLQATIFQIGMATGRPFGEVAEGMVELSKAGVALKDIGAATRVIADFSRAAGIDMARATGIGVQVLT